jgi:hypothetical protein
MFLHSFTLSFFILSSLTGVFANIFFTVTDVPVFPKIECEMRRKTNGENLIGRFV